MADDTPELGRLVVLLAAMIERVVSAVDIRGSFDAGDRELVKEIDALVMRVAHRSRSAAHYHNTARGEAALADASQIVEALKDGRVHKSSNEFGRTDSTWVEIVDYVWDKDQLDNPLAVAQGEQPNRKIVRRWYVDPNLRFMSEELAR